MNLPVNYKNDPTVLDVCCGSGFFLDILKNLVDEKNLYGVDISQKMIDLAKKVTPKVRVGSIYELPVEDQSFNLVTGSSALHHLEDLEAVFSEVHRVLKPGGVFLTDYDNNARFAKIANIKNRLLWKKLKITEAKIDADKMLHELHRKAEPQNMKYGGIDPKRIKSIAQGAGFTKCKTYAYSVKTLNHGVPATWWNSIFNNKVYTVSVR